MDFGTIVAELRKEKGISQTDLAGRLGIHKNVLGRYERNEVLPSIDIARKIADILEVSKFEEQDRNHIFSVIDAFIAKRKIQSIM